MIYIYEGILTNGSQLVALGEEQFGQEGINFGFTLDGTKDSLKVDVFSYRKESVKPFSVVCHDETSSWWIVSKDKVERYPNESGWLYKHSLQLVGAIELLNARDLTNCGFNQNTYTIEDFVLRLFQLSNFEFKTPTLTTNNNIDLEQNIDYVKTFENYTLLSALRELFDGYNCCVKLNFTRNTTYQQITGCELVITPKTGDISLQVLNIDNDFNDVHEQRNMDKNSYGTCVVSNIDNAVSSATKVYPNIGGAKLSSNYYEITPDNAIIKLPSNAFYVDSVQMCCGISIKIQTYDGVLGWQDWEYADSPVITRFYNVSNDLNAMLDEAKANILAHYNGYNDFDENDFEQHRQEMLTKSFNGGTIEFKQGVIYNPQNNSYNYKDNSYQIKEVWLQHIPATGVIIPVYYVGQVVLMDEESANGTHNPWNCIKWKRGSDEISGFGWISYDKYSSTGNESTIGFNGGGCYIPADQTINGESECSLYEWEHVTAVTSKARICINYFGYTANISQSQLVTKQCLYASNFTKSGIQNSIMALFRVKYIPMTDLKVKLDNNQENNHTHLYNQNGKLTDMVAFSKLINSYKSEIESENIVKYDCGYCEFGVGVDTFRSLSLPKLGQIVLDTNNEQYIINSVSCNLYMNEPCEYASGEDRFAQYYVECEYNLSKYVSTKSLMVNPNTNIRDYGIPQKNNVKRTQLVRDFYEFTHEQENFDLPTLYLSKVLNIDFYPKQYAQHTGVIEITYANAVNGSTKWYYQLEATTYMLKKAIYECIEFKDNNIIGYDSQNIYSGFDITKVLTGLYNLRNTPISYTDENGKFKDIKITMCNSEQMEKVYDDYKEAYSITTDLPLQNLMLFIPSAIYSYASSTSAGSHDYMLNFQNYNKDALEIPVFEYCCQLDDTQDIIVGENILESSETDYIYLYSYTLVQKGVANNNNWSGLNIQQVSLGTQLGHYIVSLDNAVEMTYYGQSAIEMAFYGNMYQNIDTEELHKTGRQTLTELGLENYDIVIARHTITKSNERARVVVANNHFQTIHGNDFTSVSGGYEIIAYVQLSESADFDTSTIQVSNVRIEGIITYSESIVYWDNENEHFVFYGKTLTQPAEAQFSDVYFNYSYATDYTYSNTKNDLMFVIRHTENAVVEDNKLVVQINCYNLD